MRWCFVRQLIISETKHSISWNVYMKHCETIMKNANNHVKEYISLKYKSGHVHPHNSF